MNNSKNWIIYCHIHDESGRRYIGLTRLTMLRRWQQHIANSRTKSGKGCHHFWNAIRKYGKDAFSHEVLAMSWDLEGANQTELAIIEQEDTRNPEKGFNLAKGGSHKPPHLNNRPWDRPEFRAAVTAGVSAKWQDSNHQIKMSKISREVNSRPEVKQKISVALTGKPISQDRKDRLADLKRGSKRSPEVNAKLAMIQASPEYLAKQRNTHLGKKLSSETKRKIAASSKSSDPEMRARIAASVRAYHERRRIEVCVKEGNNG
jgi:group I intron endonuclease